MDSVELILAIEEYADEQGVSFDVALKMLGMLYQDRAHLERWRL
jgi:hypothetical protein